MPTDKHTYRQANIHTDIYISTHTDNQSDIQTITNTDKHTDRKAHVQTSTHTVVPLNIGLVKQYF